jgi:hypothetical protein
MMILFCEDVHPLLDRSGKSVTEYITYNLVSKGSA